MISRRLHPHRVARLAARNDRDLVVRAERIPLPELARLAPEVAAELIVRAYRRSLGRSTATARVLGLEYSVWCRVVRGLGLWPRLDLEAALLGVPGGQRSQRGQTEADD